jgi:hypothetical protein
MFISSAFAATPCLIRNLARASFRMPRCSIRNPAPLFTKTKPYLPLNPPYPKLSRDREIPLAQTKGGLGDDYARCLSIPSPLVAFPVRPGLPLKPPDDLIRQSLMVIRESSEVHPRDQDQLPSPLRHVGLQSMSAREEALHFPAAQASMSAIGKARPMSVPIVEPGGV